MQLGIVGMGRMGANMVRRLLRAGHQCVLFDRNPDRVQRMTAEGVIGSTSVSDLIDKLDQPRAIWLMIPSAAVDLQLTTPVPRLDWSDIVIDSGNSYYRDDTRQARELQSKEIYLVDVGTSGGVRGLERGCWLMIGWDDGVIQYLNPIFSALATGIDAAPRIPGREALGGTAEQGYLHRGPNGAGHFVKMVYNGIEYDVMAADAEGLNVPRNANAGLSEQAVDAETKPLRDPECYGYNFDLADTAEVGRGSVISSWLLDLTPAALLQDFTLDAYAGGRVADSGEGRWTVAAAIDDGVPVSVPSSALSERFSSRGDADYADKLLSAMWYEFGGHVERHVAGM